MLGLMDINWVCPCVASQLASVIKGTSLCRGATGFMSKVVTCLPLPCRAHSFAELGDGAHWEQLMTHLMEAHQPATSPTDKAALDALPRRSVRPDDGDREGLHQPTDQQVSCVSLLCRQT